MLYKGDITNEFREAIVNPNYDEMGLTGNLSRAILSKGGQ